MTCLNTEDLLYNRVPYKGELIILDCLLLHDLGGPELVTPVDDGDLCGKPGKEGGLLHRSIPSPHNHDLFSLKEKTVTGSTPGDTAPHQPLLRLKAKPSCRGPGCNNECFSPVRPVTDGHNKRPAGEINRRNLPGHKLGIKPLSLLTHIHDELRPIDPLRESRIVVDVGSDGELAAGLWAFDNKGLQVCPRRIDGRGKTY